MRKLIGRKTEKKVLLRALQSNKSELIAVYGRRRVGKTFLIREVYNKSIQFEFSGMLNASFRIQLESFYLKLSEKRSNINKPQSWLEAFSMLEKYISTLRSRKKKVIFIDEFPWLDTRRSSFLPAFDNFWNNYAAVRDDLVVVICGSAASYMINKIVKSKAGLHNRLTEIIKLKPFNLNETQTMLKSIGINNLTRYDITQLYMSTGGVPFYLEKLLPGESVAQSIDRLFFSKNGFLRNEFHNVFASLFESSENHEKIIQILSNAKKGLTRNEILNFSDFSSGGRLSERLNELEESGFIEKYYPYKGSKDSLYRIIDEYSLFYLKFVKRSRASSSGIWMKMQGNQSYKIWSGFSFETICLKHIDQIKRALRIDGIHSVEGSWIEKGTNQEGAQIDLLIDRDDHVINLCEMKFYNDKFALEKKYVDNLLLKKKVFVDKTKSTKSIFITFITTYGLIDNKYKNQYVQNELILDDLFVEL